MRYIGSKLRLINFIQETVEKYCGKDLHDKVFCDIFAGTGVVGRTFSPLVKKVIANDLEKYSYIANHVQLKGFDENNFKDFKERFANLFSEEGCACSLKQDMNLVDAYADGGSSGRLFFSAKNGLAIQAARNFLSEVTDEYSLNDFMAILSSIMDGADKVANTMSTYGMFASKLKENALKDVSFEMPKKAANAGEQNEVYCADANELIKEIHGDILYLDPPYNGRQYSSYYFVLNAIAENRAPVTDTRSGVKNDECNKSDYNRKAKVAEALDDLIKNADFEWVFLSYNNEGLLSFDEIQEIMGKYGDYSVEATGYQRYKADNNRKQAANCVVEYLHVLHKGVFTEKENKTYNPYDEIVGNVDLTSDAVEETAPKIKVKAKIKFGGDENIVEEPKKEEKTEKENYVVSPMNYMGGKKKLLPTLLKYFPDDVKVFIDMFCGGATVGINAKADWVMFNDNLKPLIEMYTYMANNSVNKCLSYIDETIAEWGLVQGSEGKDNYYRFRDEHYNATPVDKRHPLDLFILMAYSFNNQIRFAVNKDWKFNIPFGANRSSFNDKMRENLVGFIEALHKRNCFFLSADFRDVPIDKETFVYADPPYLISVATYNDGWDEESEKALLTKLKALDQMGGRFALSNVLENKGEVNTILKEWVEENGYRVIHLDKSYANSYYQRKDKDSKTDEVLIINYECNETP